MCNCSPPSFAIEHTAKGVVRVCRHCGTRILELSNPRGSFLEDFPEYKVPRVKGKHRVKVNLDPPTDKS